MKKMAVLFLMIGIFSLGLSVWFFIKKESTTVSAEKQKGNDFEDFMIQTLGKQNDVRFVGKVSDYHKNGISALENTEPDLKFKYQNTAFAVECKWRQAFKNGKIIWAKEQQINNYKNYQQSKREKVYVALGIGGKASAPERLYLIPLYRLTREFATEDYIKEFEVKEGGEMLEILRNGR